MIDLFPEMKNFFGFGLMRLPMIEDEVDLEQVNQMVDYCISRGFNYFDTAHGYINGKSEYAFKKAVSERYDRKEYLITNKLTGSFFNSTEDIIPFFNNQLKWCGVDYFDIYLMHAQNKDEFARFKKLKAYETSLELKNQGLIKHFGISFHDKPEVLDMILTEYPEIEIVQIQLNYLDKDDLVIEGGACYDVCVKHNKPVIVMEPVKGGSLVNLIPQAQEVLDNLRLQTTLNNSNASYAIRYLRDFPNVRMIISGMSNMEQVKDNLSHMINFKPLLDIEKQAISDVVECYRNLDMIPCTSCKYCIEENHCPKDILIPNLFNAYNQIKFFGDTFQEYLYRSVFTADGHGTPDSCISCKKCEKVCPQHLEITSLLKRVSSELN